MKQEQNIKDKINNSQILKFPNAKKILVQKLSINPLYFIKYLSKEEEFEEKDKIEIILQNYFSLSEKMQWELIDKIHNSDLNIFVKYTINGEMILSDQEIELSKKIKNLTLNSEKNEIRGLAKKLFESQII